MTSVKRMVGLVAAGLLILSSGAHSLLGWKQLNGQLMANRVPPDLILGLKLGWQFGGVAMLVFGVVVVSILARPSQNDRGRVFPVLAIGVAYVTFGAWALIVSGHDPFFAIFIVPGLLLLVAALPTRGL